MKIFWKHSIIYTWTQFFSFSELVYINYFYTMLKHWNFDTIFFHNYVYIHYIFQILMNLRINLPNSKSQLR